MSLSSPARDSTRKSLPSPPVRLSSPSPPSSRSSPSWPSRTSLPSSPYRRSLPKLPKIRSLAVPPRSWSLPAPPRSMSAPLPPDRRSLPPPPSRWSVEPPPDMMFAPAVPVRRSESAPPFSLAAVAVEAVMSRRRAATSAALEGKRMPRSSAFGRQSLSRCADLRHPTNEPDIVLTRPGRSEMVVRAGRDRAPHPTSRSGYGPVHASALPRRADLARRGGLRRGSVRLERDVRSPPGADRALRDDRGRRRGGHARAR